MNRTRTGWVDLYTAQVLWAKVLSLSHGCAIRIAPASSDSPKTMLCDGQRIPSEMAQAMVDVAARAELVGRCTCDICGMPSTQPASGTHPARCNEHLIIPPSTSVVDTHEIMSSSDPKAELERMAVSCVDLALIGPMEYVQDLLDGNHDLYTACCTRHELIAIKDPWAPWVAHAVALSDLRSPRRARERLRYLDGRVGRSSNKLWNLEGLLGECWYPSEASDLLLKHRMLLAAARTCLRYDNEVLGPKLPQILAMVDTELARRAIDALV